MRPVYAKILEDFEIASFATKEVCRPEFSTEFHFHSACQMTYIVQSEGKRIIGDNVDSFSSDELTFIGSDLPHVWHNDKKKNAIEDSRSLALYIEPALILATFGRLFKSHRIESFILLSRRGLFYYGETKRKLKQKLEEIVKIDYSIEKTILLLEIINILINSNEYECISSPGYTHNYNPIDNNRIDKIFKFVFDNFTREINLDEVAAMSNMSKQAFCRYFKSRTQKTFVQFVNEVRVSEACKLIVDNNLQIANIAYCCGFNTLSNFNKIFKMIKGISPSRYKANILA